MALAWMCVMRSNPHSVRAFMVSSESPRLSKVWSEKNPSGGASDRTTWVPGTSSLASDPASCPPPSRVLLSLSTTAGGASSSTSTRDCASSALRVSAPSPELDRPPLLLRLRFRAEPLFRPITRTSTSLLERLVGGCPSSLPLAPLGHNRHPSLPHSPSPSPAGRTTRGAQPWRALP